MINIRAEENGSVFVGASFTDKEDADVIPTSIKWSLKDEEGVEVNGRTDVVVTPTAQSIEILLFGDDLPCEGKQKRLFIYFDVEYLDGSTPNVPLKDKAMITVSDSDGVD